MLAGTRTVLTAERLISLVRVLGMEEASIDDDFSVDLGVSAEDEGALLGRVLVDYLAGGGGIDCPGNGGK